MTLKTILFPTDFSDFSLYSLDYAASLAQRYGAKLVFLHVVDLFLSDPAYFAPYVPTEAMFEETRRQNFGDERIVFINAWNEWGEGAHLEPDQRFGHAWLEAIKNAADADLLDKS